MDLKYHDIVCITPLWTSTLHGQDEGVGRLINIIWSYINSCHVSTLASVRTLGSVGVTHF